MKRRACFCGFLSLLFLFTGCGERSAITTPAVEGTLPPEISGTAAPESHNWKGQGLSYTSELLGISVEFPPEWSALLLVEDDTTNSGFLLDEDHETPVDCIRLRPLHGQDPEIDCIAVIYWEPAGARGPGAESGETIRLAEKEEAVLICWLPMNQKLGYAQGSDSENLALWEEYDTVEQGLLAGEYEVET